MHARKAASVFPDPVGAEINVVRPATMCGQPCSCGSVGEPNFARNHSATSGCAHANETGTSLKSMLDILELFLHFRQLFAKTRVNYGIITNVITVSLGSSTL